MKPALKTNARHSGRALSHCGVAGGCGGIAGVAAAGFSNNNTLVVGSEQKMIEVAARVIIVADHTKFGRGGMIPVAPLNAAHIVVSDAELGSEYVAMLRDNGIEVLLA